jgi:hypothetical protein
MNIRQISSLIGLIIIAIGLLWLLGSVLYEAVKKRQAKRGMKKALKEQTP